MYNKSRYNTFIMYNKSRYIQKPNITTPPLCTSRLDAPKNRHHNTTIRYITSRYIQNPHHNTTIMYITSRYIITPPLCTSRHDTSKSQTLQHHYPHTVEIHPKATSPFLHAHQDTSHTDTTIRTTISHSATIPHGTRHQNTPTTILQLANYS